MNAKNTTTSPSTLNEICLQKQRKQEEIKMLQKSIANKIQYLLNPPTETHSEKRIFLLPGIATGIAIIKGVWNGINFFQKFKKSFKHK